MLSSYLNLHLEETHNTLFSSFSTPVKIQNKQKILNFSTSSHQYGIQDSNTCLKNSDILHFQSYSSHLMLHIRDGDLHSPSIAYSCMGYITIPTNLIGGVDNHHTFLMIICKHPSYFPARSIMAIRLILIQK